jgi:hypothetical protein
MNFKRVYAPFFEEFWSPGEKDALRKAGSQFLLQ